MFRSRRSPPKSRLSRKPSSWLLAIGYFSVRPATAYSANYLETSHSFSSKIPAISPFSPNLTSTSHQKVDSRFAPEAFGVGNDLAALTSAIPALPHSWILNFATFHPRIPLKPDKPRKAALKKIHQSTTVENVSCFRCKILFLQVVWGRRAYFPACQRRRHKS
jgi:hypothetical protein